MIGCLSTISPLFFVEMALIPPGRPGFANPTSSSAAPDGMADKAPRQADLVKMIKNFKNVPALWGTSEVSR